MKKKRGNKDKKKALDKESWSNEPRQKRRKKTKKSASDGRASSPPQAQSQHEDTVTASSNQSELQPDQDHASIPVSPTGKADAQTQTRRNVKNRETQTESISHNSHTQTESDSRCEATLQGQENTDNNSPKTNEEKGTDKSASRPPDPEGDKQEKNTTPSNCDKVTQEVDIKNKITEQMGKDPQDSFNPKLTESKQKSYAEAASNKDSREKINQTAAEQEDKAQDKAAQR